MPEAGLGAFDFVFCLGILYHLKHPLLALEIVCALTTDTAIVESFVTDANTWREHQDEVPTMEFYETDELGNQLDNWIGPSVSCLMAMCRAAGFARVEFLHTTGYHAGVVCHRKWEADSGEAPSARRRNCWRWRIHEPSASISPRARRNTSPAGSAPRTKRSRAISCAWKWATSVFRHCTSGPTKPASWLANFRLPPGLRSGWNPVRLRFADS